MGRVYVQFPKTGLGNLLLIWARALVFAHLNNLQLVCSPWWGLRLGAWKRNERKKRLYWGYFRESRLLARLQVRLLKQVVEVVKEPAVQKLQLQKPKPTLYIFRQVVVENDLFGPLRTHRHFVKEKLFGLLHPAMHEQLARFQTPVIAVHIRRGDFKLGNPITPQSFFIDCIRAVRAAAGACWPVTIFSDAREDEIAEVMALPSVALAEKKPDILDILIMSKSKVTVLSQSSTFSYWAAFLSDAVILKPPQDWQREIRNAADGMELSFSADDVTSIRKLSEALARLQICPSPLE
jgi:hypothetical protein